MSHCIAVGSDHAGYGLKQKLVEFLQAKQYQVMDLGTHSEAPCDYPDFAEAVAEAVVSGLADRGLVICGSGVGASVAANKVPGARAALCHDTFSAHQGKEDDDTNILCLGARIVGESLAKEILLSWLNASFSGAERHQRRLDKVLSIERKYFRGQT